MYPNHVFHHIPSLNLDTAQRASRPDTIRNWLHELVYELIHSQALFLALSLTLNAVSFLIVREYQPFSDIDLPLLLVCLRLTGQLGMLA